jgi:hypothetical protein
MSVIVTYLLVGIACIAVLGVSIMFIILVKDAISKIKGED